MGYTNEMHIAFLPSMGLQALALMGLTHANAQQSCYASIMLRSTPMLITCSLVLCHRKVFTAETELVK